MKSEFSWIDSDSRGILVTGRAYEQVRDSLRIPSDSLTNKVRLLSVGEGLSNFARSLREQFDVQSYALDPIYGVGKELFNPDQMIVSRLVSGWSNRVALYNSSFTEGLKEVPLPDPKRVIVGSCYELCFLDQIFDIVTASAVSEHINLQRAIPEMLRVVKEDGEIRLGGTSIDVAVNGPSIRPFSTHYDGGTGETYADWNKGLEQSIVWALSQGYSVYSFTDGLPKRSEVISRGIYKATLMIIRKDQLSPKIQTMTNQDKMKFLARQVSREEDLPLYPYIGRLYRVIDIGSMIRFEHYDKITFNAEEIDFAASY